MAKAKPKTRQDADQYLENSHSEFRRMLRKAVRARGQGKRARLYLDALSGNRPISEPLLASDLTAWLELGRYFVDEVDKLYLANPSLEFYHVTMLADEGLLYDRESYVPLSALKKKVHNSFKKKLGVEGLAVIECQGLTNWPQQARGRTLLIHVHALIWFDTRRMPSGLTNTEGGIINALPSRTWSSAFGARPISATRITKERGNPAFWAAYIMKCPHKAKRRKPLSKKHPNDWCEYKLTPVSREEGYRPEFALRIYELRTHLGLFDPIVGVGDGAVMKRRCETRIRHWNKKIRRYRRPAMRIFNLTAFRRRIKKTRQKYYAEFFVA